MQITEAEVITETSNELATIVLQSGLEQTKGQKLLQLFTPYFNRMAEIEQKINTINADDPQKEDVAIAGAIRKSLRDNRLASEKVKDEQKASILIEGRLIDNMNNIVKNTSKGLENQCEAIEKFAERKEAERKSALKAERTEALAQYEIDTTFYDLANMPDDAFADLLDMTKRKHEEKIAEAARVEAEQIERQKALMLHSERKDKLAPYWNYLPESIKGGDLSKISEDEFLGEIANATVLMEAEKQREIEREKENEKLKAEAEKKKAQEELQQKRFTMLFPYNKYGADTDMLTLWSLSEDGFAGKLRDAISAFEKQRADDKIAADKLEQERKDQQAKIDEQKKQSDKLAAELKERVEAEKKKQQAEAELAEQELSKGDKEKFTDLLNDLTALKTKYQFKSKKFATVYTSVCELIEKTIIYSQDKIK